MRVILLSSSLLIGVSALWASGNYKKSRTTTPSPRSSAPPVSRPNPLKDTSVSYTPEARELRGLKDDIYGLPRKGISIHDISLSGERFIIKGSYKNKNNFERFMEAIKGLSRYDLELQTKLKSSTFAGITTYNYAVTGLNKF